MSTRRTTPGGWVKRKRSPCRWCGGETQGRRLTFCGDECVHQWRLRSDPGYLRAQVFERDRGVCGRCGLDTEAMRRDKRKLDYAARRRFEKEWGGRRHLWDADHIVPVAEGGGECDLSNMRTVCLRCHKALTAELRQRLIVRKRSLAPGMREVDAEVLMPGKKAHKPREAKNAASVAGKGQTNGQNERDPKHRTGQYTGAGDPPLMKK